MQSQIKRLKQNYNNLILLLWGSLDVKMEINCPSPADLNRVLEDLKALIESGGIVHDDGKDYPTIPASLRIGGMYWS